MKFALLSIVSLFILYICYGLFIYEPKIPLLPQASQLIEDARKPSPIPPEQNIRAAFMAFHAPRDADFMKLGVEAYKEIDSLSLYEITKGKYNLEFANSLSFVLSEQLINHDKDQHSKYLIEKPILENIDNLLNCQDKTEICLTNIGENSQWIKSILALNNNPVLIQRYQQILPLPYFYANVRTEQARENSREILQVAKLLQLKSMLDIYEGQTEKGLDGLLNEIHFHRKIISGSVDGIYLNISIDMLNSSYRLLSMLAQENKIPKNYYHKIVKQGILLPLSEQEQSAFIYPKKLHAQFIILNLNNEWGNSSTFYYESVLKNKFLAHKLVDKNTELNNVYLTAEQYMAQASFPVTPCTKEKQEELESFFQRENKTKKQTEQELSGIYFWRNYLGKKYRAAEILMPVRQKEFIKLYEVCKSIDEIQKQLKITQEHTDNL